MHRKEKIEKIAELFARFRTEVESLNSLNLYDINVHAENVIIPILLKFRKYSNNVIKKG